MQEEEGKAGDGSSPSGSRPESAGSNMESDLEDTDEFFTTKYRYETDENGNHVLIGREGDIRRCEDEVCLLQPHSPTSRPSRISSPFGLPGQYKVSV